MRLSALGFTALGAPFHWGACHGAPPARGDPNPQLSLHPLVWVIAVGKPPHLGVLDTSLNPSTSSEHINPYKPI